MLETHPFGSFVPKSARFLLLGSFTGIQSGDWFYGTKRNQFWPILRSVYNLPLNSKLSKQDLFTRASLAITDIVYQCERAKGSNLDNNLINIVWNTQNIRQILDQNKIEKIYFSSRFVETRFRKVFKSIVEKQPHIELITLPSPSPRFAKMSLNEKISAYRDLLPKIG